MSFILDALKKSEIERQRQAVPGIMETRSGQRRSRLPLWVGVGLAVLLVVNLLVLMFVLMRKGNPAGEAPRPETARTAKMADAPTAPDHFSPLDSAPVYAPEIPAASLAGADSVKAPPAPAAAAPTAAAARRPHRSDPVLKDQEPEADAQEILPSINEMSLSGSQALPELHLDVHVYATKPADRFVYINMRKYHEGAVLQEGPTVERIRRDGVVLNYKAMRFLLPRQP